MLQLNFKLNFVSLKVHVHVCGIRKNKARETEILRTASASRREEVDKRAGRGGGDRGGRRGLPCCPSLQMTLNVNFATWHSICIKRWQANLSTRKIYFAFTSDINIVWHPKRWSTGNPSRHLPPPPPPFIHYSIPKLHLCAFHKINRQNCFRGNIFKL